MCNFIHAWFESISLFLPHFAQAKEKDLHKERQSEADRLYDLKRIELDVRALELEALERQTRRQIKMATDNYNVALAKDVETRRSQDKQV